MRQIFFIRTAASSFEVPSEAKETAVSVETKLRRYGEYYETQISYLFRGK